MIAINRNKLNIRGCNMCGFVNTTRMSIWLGDILRTANRLDPLCKYLLSVINGVETVGYSPFSVPVSHRDACITKNNVRSTRGRQTIGWARKHPDLGRPCGGPTQKKLLLGNQQRWFFSSGCVHKASLFAVEQVQVGSSQRKRPVQGFSQSGGQSHQK